MKWRATVGEINEAKSWFFTKTNKINKSLARLTKKNRENIQINEIWNKKGEITLGTKKILKQS